MPTTNDDLRTRLLSLANGCVPGSLSDAELALIHEAASALSAPPPRDIGAVLDALDELLALSKQAVPGHWGVAVGKNRTVCQLGKMAPGIANCNYDNGPLEIANAALIAGAVNFIREHGEALRAALPPQADARPAGEAVAWLYVDTPGGRNVSLHRWPRELVEPAGVMEAPLYTTPQPAPAALGGALRELVDDWRRRSQGLSSVMDAEEATDRCADELAALLATASKESS